MEIFKNKYSVIGVALIIGVILYQIYGSEFNISSVAKNPISDNSSSAGENYKTSGRTSASTDSEASNYEGKIDLTNPFNNIGNGVNEDTDPAYQNPLCGSDTISVSTVNEIRSLNPGDFFCISGGTLAVQDSVHVFYVDTTGDKIEIVYQDIEGSGEQISGFIGFAEEIQSNNVHLDGKTIELTIMLHKAEYLGDNKGYLFPVYDGATFSAFQK